MKPGREMDALVAERVMGKNLRRCEHHEWGTETIDVADYHYGICCKNCFAFWMVCCEEPEPQNQCVTPHPYYSTSISAAWEVVEKLNDWAWLIYGGERHGYSWNADLVTNDGAFSSYDHLHGDKIHSAPHAICLAALKAVGAASVAS